MPKASARGLGANSAPSHGKIANLGGPAPRLGVCRLRWRNDKQLHFTNARCGNDYRLRDCFAHKQPAIFPRLEPKIAESAIFGRVGDGLILMPLPKRADAAMRKTCQTPTATGSGGCAANGVSCVAKMSNDFNGAIAKKSRRSRRKRPAASSRLEVETHNGKVQKFGRRHGGADPRGVPRIHGTLWPAASRRSTLPLPGYDFKATCICLGGIPSLRHIRRMRSAIRRWLAFGPQDRERPRRSRARLNTSHSSGQPPDGVPSDGWEGAANGETMGVRATARRRRVARAF